jgi:hypothetical protein
MAELAQWSLIAFLMIVNLYLLRRDTKKKSIAVLDEHIEMLKEIEQSYDQHQWSFKMPDAALKHLEMGCDGDEKKLYLLKRSIELSIEHFAAEMADDAECLRIIEERVFKKQPARPFNQDE